ncbi:unnamed protein product [Protopolystoma xenopodis]|uniref:Uncharacterized protein n=1 Tax=Protopolystoma xenopodis TaxID=117903 RepID=A0A3S5BBA6_9PLAT|nr:unnamed protein product [Protopolystoma xenopodis]
MEKLWVSVKVQTLPLMRPKAPMRRESTNRTKGSIAWYMATSWPRHNPGLRHLPPQTDLLAVMQAVMPRGEQWLVEMPESQRPYTNHCANSATLPSVAATGWALRTRGTVTVWTGRT